MNDAARELLGSVERRAMEIVQLPPEEREARYSEYKRVYAETAREAGMPADIAEKMDEWVRAMVRIIEAGGGSAGGRA